MARTVETDKEAILTAAVRLIEERGQDALTARELAKALGISTQPIYREFGDMSRLRAAAAERGFEYFAERISGDALDGAAAYVMFALKHRKLFDFLFRGRNCTYSGLDDLAHKLVDTSIIDKLSEITELPVETTYRLHLFVWMALHGLAAMAADNDLPLSDADVRGMAKELTSALAAYYKR